MTTMFSAETRRDPFPLYAQVRAFAPVFQEPRTGLWMALDYDDVKRVLQDHEHFSSAASNGPRTSRWLLFSDPPRHTKLRALVSRAFTSRTVAALEPRIRELSRELLHARAGRGEMDLVADYGVPLPLMVIAELLGAPIVDYPRFRKWSDDIFSLAHTLTGGPAADEAVGRFLAAHEEMKAYLAVLLDQRRTSPKDDLITRLAEAEVDGERLDDDEILSFFQLLLLAGHETTTNLIDNAVLCLLEHPDQLALLREKPGLLPSAIEEVLRFRSPVQTMFRKTLRDVELHGKTIPAGQLVLAMIGAANRDPKAFADADRFDIRREPNPHLAFGFGIHFCVGAPLSRLEARVALSDLLRLDGLSRADDDPWEPREAFNVHGPSRLRVRFEPYVDSPV